MENQRKNLVEEIKEMSRSPNRNPQPKVGETETAGRNDGETKRGNGPEAVRGSGKVETKKGERNRTLAQRKPDGFRADESGGGEASEKSASGLGQGQREKAIAVKNRPDSRRKNSI